MYKKSKIYVYIENKSERYILKIGSILLSYLKCWFFITLKSFIIFLLTNIENSKFDIAIERKIHHKL